MSHSIPSVTVLADPLLAVLLDLALKGTVILALAGLAALALRRASAATRHLLWSLTLASLLVLPALTAVVPAWRMPVKEVWSPPASAAKPRVVFLDRVAELPLDPSTAMDGPTVTSHQEASPVPSGVESSNAGGTAIAVARSPESTPARFPWSWLAVLWLLGVAAAVAPLALGMLALRRLRRDCRPVVDGPMAALLNQLTTDLGLWRRVRLLQSHRRTMPMTWGILRPVILVPAEASEWSAERLRVVLLHELAHVQRWDCLTQLVAHLARALYWFNPLAWIAVAGLKVEQERACDDLVLRTGSDAADYAEHLLMVAAGLSSHSLTSPVALAMSKSARIQRRLTALLDPDRSRRSVGPRTVLPAAMVAACLLLPAAALRWQAPAAEPVPPVKTEAKAEPKPAAKPTESAAPERADISAKRLDQVRRMLLQMYAEKLNDKDLTDEAIKGIMAGLNDPYSEYLNPERLAEMNHLMQGRLTGIGAQLQIKDQELTIVTPLPDSPALKAGVQPGDVILTIDAKAAKGLSMTEAVKLIMGAKGTVVKLKIRRGADRELELDITRDVIKIQNATGFRWGADGRWDFLLDAENKVGYVHLRQFGSDTTQEMREILGKLRDGGIKGLILDLRFCPGGLLEQALNVCNLFLNEGTIVSIKGSQGVDRTYRAEGKALLADLPLLVLVNEQTASAAEIVAGALKDNGRAMLAGTRTYGKGSIQTIVNLEDNSGALKLTTAHYYLPSGRNIQKRPSEKNWGVDPLDGYYLPLSSTQIKELVKVRQARELLGKKPDDAAKEKLTPKVLEEKHADPQLAAALRTMVARITGGSFIKVGRTNADLLAETARREELTRRRENLQKDLEAIDRELDTLPRKEREEKR